MQRRRYRRVSSEEFLSLFSRGRPVKIARIAKTLGVDPATGWRLMRKHGTFTSVNSNAGFCVLPEMCRFDTLGFCELGGVLFFRDGGQLEAIVQLVAGSEAGMTVSEVRAVMKVNVGMQMLRLVRDGQLRREGKPRTYVYAAADAQRATQQIARRQGTAAGEQARTVGELLAEESRENLELLVNVLLTCLRHPQFSAKSVALSLIRRGEQTCTEQVRELFGRFGVRGKNC